ncbi:MAG: serine hydrolase [Ilumatobacter sp.]|nr:beta-lactamase family protein [bacterium]MDG1266322.1 serine hydrolase [Ilumatobacter sp.]
MNVRYGWIVVCVSGLVTACVGTDSSGELSTPFVTTTESPAHLTPGVARIGVPPTSSTTDVPVDVLDLVDDKGDSPGAPSGGDSGRPEGVDEPGNVIDFGTNDDPSFELGPDIELDVDGARFPADDAGVGGQGSAVDEPQVGEAPPPLAGWAAFDAAIEDALIRPGNTAASVAVSIGGDVVHRQAFGLRDPGSNDLAEPQDRFRVASISKTITAITVMQLVQDGVVGLDDPVGRLVAGAVGAGPVGASGQLTFRQLLTHRSGFGKYESLFFRGGAVDCDDAARTGLRSGASGGAYVYSNMNYCVAGLAIEAITGLSYEQAVYRSLLTPLGISGMRLAPTFDPGPDEAQHVSTPERNYMETLGAAGAWVATPTELVTILDALDASTPGFKPLIPETVLQMIVPVGGQLGQRGYGYGLISYGGNRVGHTGTIEATRAMLLNRGDGVTWAVTVAGQSPSQATDLERTINAAFDAGGFVAG